MTGFACMNKSRKEKPFGFFILQNSCTWEISKFFEYSFPWVWKSKQLSDCFLGWERLRMIRMVPMPWIRNFIFVVAANFVKLIYWIDDQVVFGGQMRHNYFFSALQIIFCLIFLRRWFVKKERLSIVISTPQFRWLLRYSQTEKKAKKNQNWVCKNLGSEYSKKHVIKRWRNGK